MEPYFCHQSFLEKRVLLDLMLLIAISSRVNAKNIERKSAVSWRIKGIIEGVNTTIRIFLFTKDFWKMC